MTTTDIDKRWIAMLDKVSTPQLAALWGKSKKYGGGRMNLLLQHLFDPLAVGEVVWDQYLAPAFQDRVNEAAGGRGRSLYAWLCGLHDVGKASPAFQQMEPFQAQIVVQAGLPFVREPMTAARRKWRHERASALILREVLGDVWGRHDEHLDWVWPMAAGHHGAFPVTGDVHFPARAFAARQWLHGDGPWRAIQDLLVRIVTVAAGWADVVAAKPSQRPTRADQLALSGFISMADWIASDYRSAFKGIEEFDQVGVVAARRRAAEGWVALGLRRGWGMLEHPEISGFQKRFGQEPRPLQTMVLEAAEAMPAAGLMVVEAPMGEGKTEAALAAAETLASRFGGVPAAAMPDAAGVGRPRASGGVPRVNRSGGAHKMSSPRERGCSGDCASTV